MEELKEIKIDDDYNINMLFIEGEFNLDNELGISIWDSETEYSNIFLKREKLIILRDHLNKILS